MVPTLNGREQLGACLDALSEHAPDAEVVVANGPSADGTTGMVRERDDVDVLVDLDDRNVNVARNAGIAAATGDVVALVSYDRVIEPSWRTALAETIDDGADVVSGPTHRSLAVGTAIERVESEALAGTEITHVNGDNVALSRAAIEELDGFDEYLETGGARDGSHRLAGLDVPVVWNDDMAVREEYGADGGTAERDWGWKYRSFAYRMTKVYGLRPSVVRRVVGHAGRDVLAGLRGKNGDGEGSSVSSKLGHFRATIGGIAVGTKDGLVARFRDRSPRRNPNGLSSRFDRAVQVYDWRGQ